MICDVSWWFVMIRDVSWWFVMVQGSFSLKCFVVVL